MAVGRREALVARAQAAESNKNNNSGGSGGKQRRRRTAAGEQATSGDAAANQQRRPPTWLLQVFALSRYRVLANSAASRQNAARNFFATNHRRHLSLISSAYRVDLSFAPLAHRIAASAPPLSPCKQSASPRALTASLHVSTPTRSCAWWVEFSRHPARAATRRVRFCLLGASAPASLARNNAHSFLRAVVIEASDGVQVTVFTVPRTHWPSQYVEVVGRVQPNGQCLDELSSVAFGDDFGTRSCATTPRDRRLPLSLTLTHSHSRADLANYEQVVQFSQQYTEVFTAAQ